MIPKKYLGAIYAFIAAICFSSKAILVKLVYQYNVDAVSSLTLRMAFSMPFFLVLAWVYRNDPYPIPENKPKKVDYFALVVLGITGYYLSSLFDFMGLQYISTGLERLIVFIYPTLVVIIAAIIFKRRIQAFEILSLSLTYIGILFIFYHDILLSHKPNTALGAFYVFLSTLTYAFYLIGSEKYIGKFGSRRYTTYAMLVSTVAVFIHGFMSNGNKIFDFTWEVYALSSLMALISTVIASLLLSEAIKLAGSSKASIIGSIGPVATITLSYFFLNEIITFAEICGGLLILAGVLMVSIYKNKKAENGKS